MIGISLIVPTMFSKDYIELLWHSFNKNSVYPHCHQFIVHINGNFPEVFDFCSTRNILCTTTEKNEGIPYAFNASMNFIEKEYVMLMNDDMYFLPNWDLAIEESLAGDKYDWRAPIMLYNYGGESPWAFLGCKYGSSPSNFQESKLLKEYSKYITNKVIVHHRPPMVIRTEVWRELKGWDMHFTPGPGGDPDFAYRFWLACNKDSSKMQSVPDSLIYHFGSATYKNTGPNYSLGRKKFKNKFGITTKEFRKRIGSGKLLFEK